jgi:hypothetical protein
MVEIYSRPYYHQSNHRSYTQFMELKIATKYPYQLLYISLIQSQKWTLILSRRSTNTINSVKKKFILGIMKQ